MSFDPKQVVRAGYNNVASEYANARSRDTEDVRLLQELTKRLPNTAIILDAGCGSGHPITELLSNHFETVGVDFAENQIRLAKPRIRQAHFLCADLTKLPMRENSFDAICSYYAIIHVPRNEHARIISDFHRILKRSGLVLLCLGAGDLPKDIATWYGTEMFWSHYDKDKNLEMMKQCGFKILFQWLVKDPIDPRSVHLFVLAQKSL